VIELMPNHSKLYRNHRIDGGDDCLSSAAFVPPQISAAKTAAIHAMRSALFGRPAPILMPTIVSAAVPSANRSGIWT
jgi:hypothetical protein